MEFIVVISFENTQTEPRGAHIYISFKSSSRFSSSSDVPYNIAYTNTTIKTDRLGPPPIPSTLIPSIRDYHSMMASKRISVETGFSRLC